MDQNHFLELKIPPPILFLAFAGLSWLLSVTVPWLHFSLPSKLLPLVLISLGGLFIGPSFWTFVRAKTTIRSDKPSRATKLVVNGVYALTRNPMYLALLFVLSGWAFYLENFAALIPHPIFVAYLNRFQIKPEEQALTGLFGQEFEAYTKKIRRGL
jgi:protein-S-isoprenylcysteine O-methyltransferase Ste14